VVTPADDRHKSFVVLDPRVVMLGIKAEEIRKTVNTAELFASFSTEVFRKYWIACYQTSLE
jgi:hypothetical protein